MDFTTHSKELDRDLTFFSDGNYIWVDINGESGVFGKQVCQGGELTGQALRPGKYFEAQCLAWLSAFVEFVKEYDLFDEYGK